MAGEFLKKKFPSLSSLGVSRAPKSTNIRSVVPVNGGLVNEIFLLNFHIEPHSEVSQTES